MGYTKGSFSKAMREILINDLAKEGERIMKKCLADKDYKDRTNNLRASYGWGVYFHGKFVRVGYSSSVPSTGKKWYGQTISGDQEVTNFFEEGGFKPPQSSESLGLVIVAAMPYGEPLENGNNFAHKKYKVIAMSADELRNLQSKYPGSSVKTILRNQIQS